MKKIFLAAIVCSLFTACSRNAVTGKNQLLLVPESEMQTMAASQYKEFLDTSKVVSPSVKDAAMVKRIGQRITTAITNYYKDQGKANILDGYTWEYNLVESNQVNAWCMPGGKIVVYTGLLPITQNEAALAVVMGHEITHALARHGSERMTQGIAQQFGGAALSVLLTNKSQGVQNLAMQAYGIGSNYAVILPFSRNQEYEADQFGLNFAAMAGYNPQEAIPLWQRMEQAAGSNRPAEFLSTHPSEGNRIARLQKQMPEALKYYKPVSN